MDTVEFAAQRAARLEDADKEIDPFVEKALTNYGQRGAWDDVVQGASVLWLETYQRENPDADYTEAMDDFQGLLIESLGKTTPPSSPPTRAEIDRVTRWVGTVTVNNATWAAASASRVRTKRWVTMHDDSVREMHRVVDGQVRSVSGKFDVGGHGLRYPGEPVGPPEVWINCRCLIAPGTVRRSMSIMTDTMAVEEPELPEAEEEVVDDEIIAAEPLVDDLEVEVPWHAVLAPEGVPTGDGRMFAVGALSTRDLPLPITYQYETAEGHMKAVVVARMDEAWKDEATGEYRARGVFWMNEPMAHKAIDGIAQGFLRGLSVDVDDIEVEQGEGDDSLEAMLDPGAVTVFSRARISGASIVHIPAFPQAYIALGPDFEDDVELEPEEVEALQACGCIDGITYSAEDEDEDEEDEEENPDIERGYDSFMQEITATAPIYASGGFTSTGTTSTTFTLRSGRIVGEVGPEYVIPSNVTFAPGTKDGPGWITHPRATARIRRYWVRGKGAAKIRWGAPGDFNRCRTQLAKYVRNPEWLAGLCANMHKEALGFWPAQHHSTQIPAIIASAEPAPMFNLVASGDNVIDASYFKEPEMAEPSGIVIDGDRIYGYVATWNVCHVGIPGKCEMAPNSPSNYAFFRTGVVHTTEGDVSVGQITMDTGHADIEYRMRPAAAHYDNTGASVADVVVGENSVGIWYSGKLREAATESQKFALEASGRVSGDWRVGPSGSLELIAVLAVNVPGFPIPKTALAASAGEVTAVVAMGMVEEEKTLVASALDAEMIAAISRTAVEEYIDQTEKRKVREERLAALAPFREKARQSAIDGLLKKIGE